MTPHKAGYEQLLLSAAVWGRAINSSLGLLAGVSILSQTSLLGVADFPAEVWVVLTLVTGLIYAYMIYRTLAYAKNSGDQQINHPIRWWLLLAVPIISLYVTFTILPRVISGWIEWVSGISVSERAVLIFVGSTTLLSYVGQAAGAGVGVPELYASVLVVDGVLGLIMAWTLRRALFSLK